MIQTLFGYASGIFMLGFYVTIIQSILSGQTKPSRTSWFIWWFNDFLIFFSSYAIGARNTLWVPAVYVSCGLICFVLSLKHDPQPLSILDKLCLAGTVLGFLIWIQSNDEFVALCIGTAVNALGAVPTWRRAYADSKSQVAFPWLLGTISGICQLISVEEPRVSLIIFPLSSFLICLSILLLTLRPRALRS